MPALLGRLLLAAWAAVLLLVGGSLMAGHWVTLPAPAAQDPTLQAAVAASRRADEVGRWLALHVLYAECRCSQRIAAELLADSDRSPAVAERVLLIGSSAPMEAAIQAAGLGLEVLTPEALAERYTLTAAPLLVLADPSDQIWYIGGYTDRKQGPVRHDRQIIADALAGAATPRLPLFGCAVSRSLQEALDPLSLKY